MPVSKKEQVIFGVMMCTGMVLVMMTFNLWQTGMIHQMSVMQMLLQFVIALIIAFVVESFIVGPVARKIAFSLPFAKSSKIKGIITMSLLMVIGMVLIMSLFGIVTAYFTDQFNGISVLGLYLHTIVRNFSLALPLQLIVLGPLVRYMFSRMFKNETTAASV
ncbi:hypothetical protein HUB98_19655 [Paenibacillus barcinonensis]|uniref:DUF2798 domain-containing protein n=1 Tax=Paenibacillus barcinonensis TaxID=198119 RepID=A0A2V4WII1_PAEBA|nr:hypothetical protein [Paenibacillus barcinonensis]PYE47344.1 hypothetical protein DFQ00_11485 [Paenibacillus barcinonensis]QKS58240.1 hypothetical protein HUB98_19655 [Paenibacillus barcinonensis]